MRKAFIGLLVFALIAIPVSASGSGESAASAELSPVEEIIQQAEGMSMEELAKKAIEESNGKMFYGVGNSSRGKTALPLFISYLQTIDPNYTLNYEWQQPKNNKIFDQLTADSLKSTGTFAMTLIQDGNQIESKMVRTGILDTFIPKEWAEANGTTAAEYTGYLPLQTLNKVFMYNNTGDKSYDNVWDFVAPGEHGLFMDIDSEIVGKNFLLDFCDESQRFRKRFDRIAVIVNRVLGVLRSLEKTGFQIRNETGFSDHSLVRPLLGSFPLVIKDTKRGIIFIDFLIGFRFGFRLCSDIAAHHIGFRRRGALHGHPEIFRRLRIIRRGKNIVRIILIDNRAGKQETCIERKLGIGFQVFILTSLFQEFDRLLRIGIAHAENTALIHFFKIRIIGNDLFEHGGDLVDIPGVDGIHAAGDIDETHPCDIRHDLVKPGDRRLGQLSFLNGNLFLHRSQNIGKVGCGKQCDNHNDNADDCIFFHGIVHPCYLLDVFYFEKETCEHQGENRKGNAPKRDKSDIGPWNVGMVNGLRTEIEEIQIRKNAAIKQWNVLENAHGIGEPDRDNG